jgi:citrate lyase subunit beta/citryl-CoA lyase
MVQDTEALMEEYGAPASTQIWAMIETPLGVLHAERVAMASTRLTVFIMGTNDLAEDLQAIRTSDRAALLPHLTHCLLVARSYGMVVIDGVYNKFKDAEGFRDRCLQSRQLGFDGKTLIHPTKPRSTMQRHR